MRKSVLSTISSIMEVAQPLSQGEQNFKALHGPLEPKKDLVPGVTDQDHIFNGTPRKEDPKTASYENFRDDDESKEAYDKTLKVSEEPETDKDVKEEVEQVEEVTAVEEEVEAVDEAMKGEAEYNARYGAGGKKRPPLDPVGKEDSDINNDGKVNSSDSYLSNKRKVISKYLKKEDTEVVAPVKKVEVKEEDSFVKTDWKAILTKKAVAEETYEEEVEEIVESLKLLKTYKAGEHTAKVYKDTDWDEHRVKFFSGDKHHKDADYHTDDVEDAHDTAKTQLKDMAKKAMQEQIDLELNEKKNMDIWSAVVARLNEKQNIDESEQLDELSKATLASYAKRAATQVGHKSSQVGYAVGTGQGHSDHAMETSRKNTQRAKGLSKAIDKLAKEELEVIGEKHLTPAEMKKREEIAKAIAKKNPDMPMGKKMAIATATAKKVAEEVDQIDELSDTTLQSYRTKALAHRTGDLIDASPEERKAKLLKTKNRDAGKSLSWKKMINQGAKVPASKPTSDNKETKQVAEAQFSKDQLNSAMSALEKTKKAAAAEKDTKKRTQHLMRQNFLTKQLSYMRSAISSEGMKAAKVAEEIEAVAEAVDVDVNMHEFMAGKAKRAIDVLKKNNRPIPDELLRTYEKHKQEIAKYKKDVGKQRNEGVDFATARSDRGAVKTYVKYGKDGKTELVSRRDPRKEIKIGEETEQVEEASYSAKAARAGKDIGEKGKNFATIAKDAAKRYGSKEKGENVAGAVLAKIRSKHMSEALNNDNMMQASVDKLKSDPLASKTKIKLPPSQGLKPVGGDEQTHANMAEEKLNRLYESLSERNKVKFMQKLETDEGFEQLIRFAEEQGF